MSTLDLARPELRHLQPYNAAAQVEDTIRLNANEMPLTSASDGFRRPLNRYPEVRPARLQELLARRFDCAAENLLVTRGSSEAIDLLLRVFCRAGVDNIVTTSPSFSMYSHYAYVQGAALREVVTCAKDDFAVAAREVISACDDNTRVVFLCSPNNPTGTVLDRQSIIEIVDARQGKSLVVVDEAYVEFARQNSCVDLLDRFDNLVVLRTLSKALAFAGLRCGVAIAGVDAIRLLNAVQAPYAMSTPVVECIEDALGRPAQEDARQQIATIVSERERVAFALRDLPIVTRVFSSEANFLLIEVRGIDAVLQQLREDRILLRFFGDALANCVRITIGSSAENDQLLQSLGSIAESQP